MNSKAIQFIKNSSYTLISNIISFFISTLLILIIPRLIGVEAYSFWQLYIFYTSYVLFLQFGWNEGIHLRYAGQDYDNLDKKKFFTQYYMMLLMQLLIGISITFITPLFVSDLNRLFIIRMTIVCMFIFNLRHMLIYILQGTNRIKKFSQIIILDRVIYLALILLLILMGIRDYKIMIIADLVAKAVSLLFAMYSCKEITFRSLSDFNFNCQETIANMSVGVKLMFASIVNILILGLVKFGIEWSWGVVTFGEVSLAFS
ncbi:MAG: oligosaccharide flippase family protein, partial [Oscillospiraceae bacterium]|nr:oligosaccharide flippase family protein [Oscillospiraceae bacterium]